MKSSWGISIVLIFGLGIGVIFSTNPSLRSQLVSEVIKIWNNFQEEKERKTTTTSSPSPTILSPTISSSPYLESSQAPLQSRIRKIAEKSTVFISIGGQVVGSGVLIGQNNNTLYVLTASHVIGIKPGRAEDPYKITTHDGEQFKIGYENYEQTVKLMPNSTDLAILVLNLKIQLSNQGRVAKLASFVAPNMPIYIFGYLPCSPLVKGLKSQQNQLSKGNILKVESSPKFDSETQLRGYDIYYNNNTVQGMSGSPVFDTDGRVVAIHAKAEKSKLYDSENCESLPSEPRPDFGDNWGISIKTFANLKSDLPSSLRSKLVINSSPSSSDTETQPFVPVPSPSCPPFIGEGYECTEQSE